MCHVGVCKAKWSLAPLSLCAGNLECKLAFMEHVDLCVWVCVLYVDGHVGMFAVFYSYMALCAYCDL